VPRRLGRACGTVDSRWLGTPGAHAWQGARLGLLGAGDAEGGLAAPCGVRPAGVENVYLVLLSSGAMAAVSRTPAASLCCWVLWLPVGKV
jgi:hypothetical protein